MESRKKQKHSSPESEGEEVSESMATDYFFPSPIDTHDPFQVNCIEWWSNGKQSKSTRIYFLSELMALLYVSKKSRDILMNHSKHSKRIVEWKELELLELKPSELKKLIKEYHFITVNDRQGIEFIVEPMHIDIVSASSLLHYLISN
jgi:hypothetical protein